MMVSWVLQSLRRPSRVCGSLSKVLQRTSCLTPPTLMHTRRLSALERIIMKGSGGSEDMDLEYTLCCICNGNEGGRGGEAVGKGAKRTSELPPPPTPSPGGGASLSSHRTASPSSRSPTMDCSWLGVTVLTELEGFAHPHPPLPSPPLRCRILICNSGNRPFSVFFLTISSRKMKPLGFSSDSMNNKKIARRIIGLKILIEVFFHEIANFK